MASVNKHPATQTVDVLELRRNYALYVIRSRAIPAITDGLKPSGRRPLWVARDGKKVKVASLAGATMYLHPHDECSSAICNLAAPYKNNVPLFSGDGAFGTLLEPSEFGAPRYTSCTISKFAQDVILADLDDVPLTDNYDNTAKEPIHFLPLIPVCIINPASGIAVGFHSNILPRDPIDVIEAQIEWLSTGRIKNQLLPKFLPTDNPCFYTENNEAGVATVFYFKGSVEITNTNTVTITKLPFGMVHDDVINKLEQLLDAKAITDYIDDSRNVINIKVKFKRDALAELQEGDLIEMFGLVQKHHEHLNLLTIDGQSVQSLTARQVIEQFSEWRLSWYVNRFQTLLDRVNQQIVRHQDIVLAIDNKANVKAAEVQNRDFLKQRLATLGVRDVDAISQLPIYRFTPEEAEKSRARLKELVEEQQLYQRLLSDENERKKVYIADLKQISKNFKKGVYHHG
jgi:topoisomerase-4 subunit A